MYSRVVRSEQQVVKIFDKQHIKTTGYIVTRNNGTEDFITHKDLNMPFRNFRQIYQQRTFGIGPPKHRRSITPKYGQNDVYRDWRQEVFNTLNNTLGLSPEDPEFIIEIKAQRKLGLITYTDQVPQISGEPITNGVTLIWNNGDPKQIGGLIPQEFSQ